jgi:hypothetical protein
MVFYVVVEPFNYCSKTLFMLCFSQKHMRIVLRYIKKVKIGVKGPIQHTLSFEVTFTSFT